MAASILFTIEDTGVDRDGQDVYDIIGQRNPPGGPSRTFNFTQREIERRMQKRGAEIRKLRLERRIALLDNADQSVIDGIDAEIATIREEQIQLAFALQMFPGGALGLNP